MMFPSTAGSDLPFEAVDLIYERPAANIDGSFLVRIHCVGRYLVAVTQKGAPTRAGRGNGGPEPTWARQASRYKRQTAK